MTRYATAAAFRHALEQRINNSAAGVGHSITRLRKLSVFDRMLARLVVTSPESWHLKGAVALDYRFGGASRTTVDMDLGRQDDADTALAAFRAMQALDLGDHFRFAIDNVRRVDLRDGVQVARYRFHAELAGRRFETVVVDVGFAAPPVVPLDSLAGPNLFAFAGFDTSVVPVVSLEQHIAEKVHAYTGIYAGGRPSTRVKDLVDLVIIVLYGQPRADRLRAALLATFGDRPGQPVPSVFPFPPDTWQREYAYLAGQVGQEPDVALAHAMVRQMLDPILSGAIAGDSRWDPRSRTWEAMGLVPVICSLLQRRALG